MTLGRRLFALLIVAVYAGFTIVQSAAMVPTPASTMAGTMMQQQTEAGAPMPCKGTMPGCMTQVGCVFLVSLPAFPDLSLFTATEWTSVAYSLSSQFLEGRSIKPALGPPISRA